MRISEHERNHIKTSLSRLSLDDIASEIGRAKRTVKNYVSELREKERVKDICG